MIVRDEILLLDAGGLPIADATSDEFTTKSVRQLGGETSIAVTITNVGGGVYETAWTPNPATGTWSGMVVFVRNGLTRRFRTTWEAPSTIAAAVVSQPVAGSASGSLGAKVGSIGAGTVTVVSPIAADESVTIANGTPYVGANALTWVNDTWGALNPTAVTFTAYANDRLALSTAAALEGSVLTVELSSLQTASLAVSSPWYGWRYEINATLSPSGSTKLVGGDMTVTS